MENFSKAFFTLQANQFKSAKTTAKQRIKKLEALQNAIEKTYRKALQKAVYADFKKPFVETDITEIYPLISEIKYTIKHLKSWMRKQKVATPIALLGSRSWYVYEPKGVCLIIAPWNYPISLTFSPLIAAIAAGNVVLIKPSELTKNTTKILQEIITAIFPKEEVFLATGGAETATKLLKLPFHHIFFTGSPAVGKLVMEAASKNLTSVTLELGGKSPVIIDTTISIKMAAKRIAWGKFINNGQTCIAPDYVFVPASKQNEFIQALQQELLQFYSVNPEASNSYCRIVNTKHFKRLQEYLEDAISKGAKIEFGGTLNPLENYFSPTLLTVVPEDALVLQEEIFGPILPIKTYTSLEEVLDYITAKPKPLALYIFSKNSKTINTILQNTRAGSTAINQVVLQFANESLPFGGTNTSGIGKSHGFFGFQEFSNKRSVLKQNFKGSIEWLFPPYTKFTKKLIDATIKWL